MQIRAKHYETIWIDEEDPCLVKVIDQQKLPFEFSIRELRSLEDAYDAILNMSVRGAPLIGATAALGLYLAALEVRTGQWLADLEKAAEKLLSSRPTAVNLQWATDRVMKQTRQAASKQEAVEKCLNAALEVIDDERENSRKIGEHGVELITTMYKNLDRTVNILTHCNAGWLACIDYGTVLAPVYMAHDMGIPVHVWVDETRPRNQGARLTAYELGEHGVPHTVIADNAGGHLMQHGKVDMVIMGCVRATASGDVANKTGTYLKALAAEDNNIPCYIALPTSSIDYGLKDGLKEIEIEERSAQEVTHMEGVDESSGEIRRIRITPKDSPAENPAFDVTPARLITGYITEQGVWDSIKA